MPVTLILNGTPHTIPVPRDQRWGSNVTGYLQDIAEVLNGTFQTVTASTASTVVDFNKGKNVRLVLESSTNLTFSNPRGGRPAYFYIKQSGAKTITWPDAVKWRGRTPPTLSATAGYIDVSALMYEPTDGIYLGEFALNFG